MEELFAKLQKHVLKTEQCVLDQIDSEVNARVNIRINAIANHLSSIYGVSAEIFVKQISEVESDLCKGIKKDKSKCLKQPRENGYCGFHQKQVPPPKPKEHARVPCPWEET